MRLSYIKLLLISVKELCIMYKDISEWRGNAIEIFGCRFDTISPIGGILSERWGEELLIVDLKMDSVYFSPVGEKLRNDKKRDFGTCDGVQYSV